MASTMEDVFEAYAEPAAEEESDLHLDYREYMNRVLHRDGPASKIHYREYGLLFWFSGEENGQIALGRI